MTYVMSDIHGMYDKYMKMLDLIEFSENDDELYILGDVVDRGEKPAEVLLDMMKRPNVYPIIGNHELMAMNVLDVMFNGENGNSPVPVEAMLGEWLTNGGAFTLDSISKRSDTERLDIIDYLSEFTNYETIDIGDKSYIMVHAGFDNFRPDRKLSDYTVDELVWHRQDPSVRYFNDKSIHVISGHTPTFALGGEAKIIHESGNIFIDCGACFENGKLACLCLDTMEEFYI